jgi:TPR repeat protein
MLVLATLAGVQGCGEKVPPAPIQQTSASLFAEQTFAEALYKAEAGDAKSQFNLGVMYSIGKSVPIDDLMAFKWYEKAATQGFAAAQYNLGLMYDEGDGVPKDHAKAFEWFQRAAALGDADAQTALGLMYNRGNGVPKDYSKAFDWFQKAALKGDATAQLALGTMYSLGEGVSKDEAKAVEWYRKAAIQGNAAAQTAFGMMHHYGKGIGKDHHKAFDWFMKAAAQGDAMAQAYIGDAYHDGKGIPKDTSKAVEWYGRAAAQGNADAQANLGLMYYNGDSVAQDVVLAYAWLNLAASRAGESAIKSRMEIEAHMTPTQLAEAQRISLNWMKGMLIVREGDSGRLVSSPNPSNGTLSRRHNGTIFVVSKTGQAITNQHVTAGCSEFRIQGREGVVKLITEDAVNDLALVQIKTSVTDAATIAFDPGKLRQGEDVVVFGFPLNSLLSSGGNLTPGVVSALTGLGNNTNQIQITAPIQPGSSGSPVLNKKGEVIGVVSMKLSDSKMMQSTGQIGQSVNFATSAPTIKSFLDVNMVKYRNVGSSTLRDKSTADLADEARKWTLLVECWR